MASQGRYRVDCCLPIGTQTCRCPLKTEKFRKSFRMGVKTAQSPTRQQPVHQGEEPPGQSVADGLGWREPEVPRTTPGLLTPTPIRGGSDSVAALAATPTAAGNSAPVHLQDVTEADNKGDRGSPDGAAHGIMRPLTTTCSKPAPNTLTGPTTAPSGAPSNGPTDTSTDGEPAGSAQGMTRYGPDRSASAADQWIDNGTRTLVEPQSSPHCLHCPRTGANGNRRQEGTVKQQQPTPNAPTRLKLTFLLRLVLPLVLLLIPCVTVRLVSVGAPPLWTRIGYGGRTRRDERRADENPLKKSGLADGVRRITGTAQCARWHAGQF